MKTASVSYAKAHLSALLERVRAGEPVVITDRGAPVARLEPIVAADWGDRMRSLVARGLVAPPALPAGSDMLLELPPAPVLPTGASLVGAVLEQRGEGP